MSLEAAFALSIAIILLTIKPGPGVLAIISRSLSGGFPSGLAITLGISTIHMVFYGIVVAGLSLLETQMEFISFLFKSLGAMYLIYVGVKGLSKLENGTWDAEKKLSQVEELKESYISGLAITLANPLTILFYSAIIPSVFPEQLLDTQTIILAAIVILTTQISFISIGILGVAHIRNFLKQPKTVIRINLSMSIIFILLGLFLGLSTFPIFNKL